MSLSELSAVTAQIKQLIDRLNALNERHRALTTELPGWYETSSKKIKQDEKRQLAQTRLHFAALRENLQHEIDKHNPNAKGSGIEWRKRGDEKGKLVAAVRSGSASDLAVLGYSLPQDTEQLTLTCLNQVKKIRDELASAEHAYNAHIQALRKDLEVGKAQLKQRREAELLAVDEAHAEKIQSLEEGFESCRKRLEEELSLELGRVVQAYDQTVTSIEDGYRSLVESLEAEEQAAKKLLDDDRASGLRKVSTRRAELMASLSRLKDSPPSLPLSQRPWTDADWQPFVTPLAPPKHGQLRLGRKYVDTPAGKFELPVLVPFLGESHLWIHFERHEREPAIDYAKSLLIRLYAAMVPGKLSVLLYDPTGGGFDFRVFTTTLPREQKLFEVVNRSGDLEKALDKLSREAISTNQAVPTDYESAFEMNAFLEKDVHPHKIIVLKDFPSGLDKRVFERLDEVGQSGHKSGLHIIGLVDDSKGDEGEAIRPDPSVHGINVLLKQDRVYFSNRATPGRAGTGTAKGANADPLTPPGNAGVPKTLTIKFFFTDTPYNKDFPQTLLEEIHRELEAPRNISKRFLDNLPEEYDIGSEKAAPHLRTPVGFTERTSPVHLQLDDKNLVHAFVVGMTGVGKSTLVTQIIAGLCTRYSPSELELVLLDDKAGVEFARWRNLLPHVSIMELGRDTNFALAILEHLTRVMTERNELFMRMGSRNISMFKKSHPDILMPRIAMIWDNAYEAFKDDQDLSDRVLDTLNKLATDGRSVGIHMILVTNHLHGIEHGLRGVRSQFAIRINFQNEGSVFEHASGDERATLPRGKGEAQCVGLNQSEPHKVQLVKFFELDDNDQLELESFLGEAMGKYHPPNPKVLAAGDLAHPDLHRDAISRRLSESTADEIPLWLGEPVSISDPMHLTLDRRFGCNVLLAGDERLLSPLLALELEYLLALRDAKDLSIHVFLNEVASPETQEVLSRCPIDTAVRHSYEEFIRSFTECTEQENGSQRHVFVIWNMERLLSVKAKDEGDEDLEELWRDLPRHIQSAPQKGVQLIAWTPTASGVQPLFSPDDPSDVFIYRVASDLDRENMRLVATGNWYQRLGLNRAVLLSRDATPLLFAPYGWRQPILG